MSSTHAIVGLNYADLYQDKLTTRADRERLLSRVSTLGPAQRAGLARPFTLAELHRAVKQPPRNKAPGPDGIPAGLYIREWDVLGLVLLQVLNAIQDTPLDALPRARSHIHLAHKGLTNMRPISLIDSDERPSLGRSTAGSLAEDTRPRD